ncbi:MAG TPA: threonine/serine dehydratase [Acidobacteriaceae bacterium]|nr:threonine/serine dehydratase [Acidobacteriaceae bacterium]
MPSLITLADILTAQTRIASTAVRTPLVRLSRARLRMAGFADLADNAPDIYLKDESAQPIGSFKLRGAYNKIAQLTPEQLKRGVITYSSGNHAQGVAYAARALGSKAVIVMPDNAPQIKRDATAALGAEIVTVGPASTDRRLKAEELEALHGYTMVPPYDDDAIIAGQATCGLEILEQLPNADLILSPVSGGGLLSGVATAVKLGAHATQNAGVTHLRDGAIVAKVGSHNANGPQVWGCEPDLSADAKESFDTRTLVEWPAAKTSRTLADGLRTQSLGERNFAHVMQFVDGIVAVSEEEIRTALRVILTATALTAEPSGAVTLAAALFHAHELPRATKIVAILSGGNLDPALRAELLQTTV